MSVIKTIQDRKDCLEKIIVDVAQEYYNARKPDGALSSEFPDFCYDLLESCKELERLGKSKDCRYDRPTIGFAYSLRFHPKRFNQWIKFINNFIDKIETDQILNQQKINVFDVGAGTGSVAWAWAIVLWARGENKCWCPKVNLYNVDNAAFMIEYNKLLWEKFAIKHPSKKINIHWDFTISAKLADASKQDGFYNILQLSYYFDSSDLGSQDGIDPAKNNVLAIQSMLNIKRVLSVNASAKRIAKDKIWGKPNHPENILKECQYVFQKQSISAIDCFVKKLACKGLTNDNLKSYWVDYFNEKENGSNGGFKLLANK